MSNRPTSYDDMIDSRDIIAAIEELTEEIAALTLAEDIEATQEEIEDLDADDPDNAEELETLREKLAALTEEAEANAEQIAELREELAPFEDLAKEGYAADWHHGETLIRDSYF